MIPSAANAAMTGAATVAAKIANTFEWAKQAPKIAPFPLKICTSSNTLPLPFENLYLI